jgi:WD40 repeat protein
MTLILGVVGGGGAHPGLAAEEVGLPIAVPQRQAPVDFQNNILPILRRNCLACHNKTDAESGLVLESPKTILAGGSDGPAVIAGKAEESRLLKSAAHRAEPFMPPEDNERGAKNLTPEELGLLKLWIDQGDLGEVTAPSTAIHWQPLPARVNPIYAVAVSPHGKYVAASRANQIFLYHVGTKKPLGRVIDPALESTGIYGAAGAAHLDLVQSLAFSPDGQWLASGGFRTVKLWRRSWPVRQIELVAGGQHVTALARAANAAWVAVGCENGDIVLIDPSRNVPAKTLAGHQAEVTGLAFSRDASHLVSGSRDETIRHWNLAEGRETGRTQSPAAVTAVALVRGDGQVAAGGADNVIRIWSLPLTDAGSTKSDPSDPSNPSDQPDASAHASPAQHIQGHTAPITALATMPPEGLELVSGSEDGSVRIWDVPSGRQVREMNHGGPVWTVAVRGDGQQLASAGENRRAKLWNAADGKLLAEMYGNHRNNLNVEDARRAVELAKQLVANAKGDLDAANKRKEEEENAAKKSEEEMKKGKEAFDQKSQAADKAAADKHAAATELDQVREDLKNREAQKQQAEKELEQATEENRKAREEAKQSAEKGVQEGQQRVKEVEEKVKQLTEAADKANGEKETATRNLEAAERSLERSRQAASSAAARVPIAQTGLQDAEQALASDERHVQMEQEAASKAERPFKAIAYSPDGAELAVAADNGLVHTFQSSDGSPIEVFSQREGQGALVAYLADGQLVAGGKGQSLATWPTLPEWKHDRTIGAVDAPTELVHRVTAIAFSPDGLLLAAGGGEPSRSGQLTLWSVQDGHLVREIADAHSDTVLGIEFSPDGRQIASCGADRFMKVFDVATGKFVRAFEGHTHHVLGISWRADGRELATCGADNVIKVWDALTGDQKRTITGFGKEITAIQFLGLEHRVVVSTADNQVTTRKTDGDGGLNFADVSGFMYTVRSSRDGKTVASGGHDSVLRVWNREGQPIATFAAPTSAAENGGPDPKKS